MLSGGILLLIFDLALVYLFGFRSSTVYLLGAFLFNFFGPLALSGLCGLCE